MCMLGDTGYWNAYLLKDYALTFACTVVSRCFRTDPKKSMNIQNIRLQDQGKAVAGKHSTVSEHL